MKFRTTIGTGHFLSAPRHYSTSIVRQGADRPRMKPSIPTSFVFRLQTEPQPSALDSARLTRALPFANLGCHNSSGANAMPRQPHEWWFAVPCGRPTCEAWIGVRSVPPDELQRFRADPESVTFQPEALKLTCRRCRWMTLASTRSLKIVRSKVVQEAP